VWRWSRRRDRLRRPVAECVTCWSHTLVLRICRHLASAVQTTLLKDNEVVYFLMVGKLDTTDVVDNGILSRLVTDPFSLS
jgi:hypothetical protein